MTDRFAAFCARARPRSLVPVWRDVLLDLDTPVTAFARLRGAGTSHASQFAFLLESAPAGSDTWARFTFLGVDPVAAWRLADGVIEDWSAEHGWHGRRTPTDPIEDLRARLTRHEPVPAPEIGPFWGGAVGYFGYDVVRHIERLPSPPPRGVAAPDALFVFTRTMVIIDNLRAQARVTCAVAVDDDTSDAAMRAAFDSAQRDMDSVITRLRNGRAPEPIDLPEDAPPATGRSTYARE